MSPPVKLFTDSYNYFDVQKHPLLMATWGEICQTLFSLRVSKSSLFRANRPSSINSGLT
jgi:hypothetical protein